MESNYNCNIVTIGKTGVGKSALQNYLFGTDFKSDSGNAVTKGIHLKPGFINGTSVNVFDSEGIEPDKVSEWFHIIYKQIEAHGASKNPEDWFHAVVYCVSAGSHRIENIDIELISYFVQQKYRVVVALTNCDLIRTDKEQNTLIQTILDEVKEKTRQQEVNICVIPVCSVKIKKMNGEVSEPKGRQELSNAILSSWKETIKDRVPTAVVARLAKQLDDFEQELHSEIGGLNISGRPEGNKKITKELEEKITKKMNSLQSSEVIDITNDLLQKCYTIGYNLQNSLTRADDTKLHTAFRKFEVDSNHNIGWRYTAYIAGFGIPALVWSYGSGAVKEQKENIKKTVSISINSCKELLREKITPQLKEQITQLVRNGNEK